MKRKRIFIILGVLLALAAVFMFFNLRSTDDARAQLDTVFNNSNQIVELSSLAVKDGSVYGLKVAAANLAASTASDSQQLTVYYQERYGKEPKEIKLAKDTGPVAELEATEGGVGFDAAYKERVTPLLEANISVIRGLYEQTSRQQFRELLETIFNNQATGLDQLNKLQ